jgi:hypothetical protein
MSMNNSASGLTTASSCLTRLPFLASPSLHFNLADDISELRNQDSWKRNSGRSSKTLVKYPDLHVLILMRADSQRSEHHVDAHISIHLLQEDCVFSWRIKESNSVRASFSPSTTRNILSWP